MGDFRFQNGTNVCADSPKACRNKGIASTFLEWGNGLGQLSCRHVK
jgi:hypothetical protein